MTGQCTRHGSGPDGAPLDQVTIGTGALRASVLTIGAALRDLRLDGHDAPLILGYRDPRDYLTNPHYLGTIVGRCANRIANGAFILDGQRYELDRNERGLRCLHGGSEGASARNWRLADHGADHVTLTLDMADGHMGFPGALSVRCTYRTEGAALFIELRATSDAPTFCNFASHVYYTLSGGLQVDAARYLPVDNAQIPLPEPHEVAGTPFDFRTLAPLSGPLDHNFCLSETRVPLRDIARLETEAVRMRLATSEAGLQVYDGAHLDTTGQIGLTGAPYGPHAGIAIEPQAWPDAPNQAWAAQALLGPGETYASDTRLDFEKV